MNPAGPLEALRHGDEALRARLAERRDTPPEMLFFLAADPAITVRAAIAANASTPAQADQVLSRDEDPRVRRVLARKLAALAPTLDPDAQDRLRRTAWETLRTLVEDEVVAVRAAITELVAELPDAPRALILRLAHDTAMPVADPVLRLSPVLRDEDLLALIASPPTPEAVRSIARRPELGEAVSDAIAGSDDATAVAALLGNGRAAIPERTVERLAAQCGTEASWQAGLIRRPRLSERAARTLSGIVTDELLRVLAARPDLDPALLVDLGQRIAGRRGTGQQAWGMDEAGFLRAARAGGARECAGILAALSGLPAGAVGRAIAARRGRAIVALCWKAGLSLCCAKVAQVTLAGIPASEALGAAGHWGLTQQEMTEELGALVAPPIAAVA